MKLVAALTQDDTDMKFIDAMETTRKAFPNAEMEIVDPQTVRFLASDGIELYVSAGYDDNIVLAKNIYNPNVEVAVAISKNDKTKVVDTKHSLAAALRA